jgi:glutamine amidotransferase/cyclase
LEGAAITVPHIGWNGLKYEGSYSSCALERLHERDIFYFVHSYRVVPADNWAAWALTTTSYAGLDFVSSVQNGNILATQFHPEKSGEAGLRLLGGFLDQHVKV